MRRTTSSLGVGRSEALIRSSSARTGYTTTAAQVQCACNCKRETADFLTSWIAVAVALDASSESSAAADARLTSRTAQPQFRLPILFRFYKKTDPGSDAINRRVCFLFLLGLRTIHMRGKPRPSPRPREISEMSSSASTPHTGTVRRQHPPSNVACCFVGAEPE